jgi:hypothetical protein
MVVASIALLAALGGTSVAAVVNVPDNSVGTSKIKNNAVTAPKIASNAVTSAKIAGNAVNSAKIANGTIQPTDLSASAKTSGPTGPAGPPGPTGPSGPAGASATALWAVVDSNGTLVRNRNATSAQKIGTGQYQVIFNQDVTGCSYQATSGGPTLSVFAADVGVGQLTAVPGGVRVNIFNISGAAAIDTAFNLAVFC